MAHRLGVILPKAVSIPAQYRGVNGVELIVEIGCPLMSFLVCAVALAELAIGVCGTATDEICETPRDGKIETTVDETIVMTVDEKIEITVDGTFENVAETLEMAADKAPLETGLEGSLERADGKALETAVDEVLETAVDKALDTPVDGSHSDPLSGPGVSPGV